MSMSREVLENRSLDAILTDLSEAAFKNRTSVVVYLSAISLGGLLGNLLVVLVFGFRFKPCATRVFVLYMAFLDLVVNCVALPLQIYTIRHAYDTDLVSCRCLFAFSTLNTQSSGFVLVLVSVDRFWRICLPLQVQLSARKAFLWASCVVFGTFVIFASFIPYYGIHYLTIPTSVIEVRMCWSDNRFKDSIYPKVYKVVVGLAFCLGLSIMLVCYCLIGIRLWRKKIAKKKAVEPSVSKDISDKLDTSKNAGRKRAMSKLSAQMRKHTHDHLERPTFQIQTELGKDGRKRTVIVLNKPIFHNAGEQTGSDVEIDGESETWVNEHKKSMDMLMEVFSNASDHSTQSGGSDPGKIEPQPEVAPRTQHAPWKISKEPDGSTQTCEEVTTQVEILQPQVCKFVLHIRSHTTLMMCILTVLYLSNWLPHLIMRSIRDDPVNLCDHYTECGYNGYAIAMRSYYLNSAVNAIVYSICNKRFRQECGKMFSSIYTKL